MNDLCINQAISLREAMRVLDNIGIKILVLVDDKNRLVGTLTDGDVRRFLLAGGQMDDCAAAAANRNAKYARTPEQAEELYDKAHYIVIPIVNERREVTDVFAGRTEKPRPRLGIPVVINAGGKGTRLDPFTRVLPKPLIPVGELPIIEHIIRRFGEYGCTDVRVIVNYKKQLLKAYFNESERQYPIIWYDEEQPLGTGGGLRLLKGTLEGTFFFTSCDTLLLSDYAGMLKFHRDNGNAVTMVGAYKNLKLPYGVVDIGEGGVIEGFREKPEMSFLTNTGTYLVEPEVLEDIADGEEIGFPDVVERQRRKGLRVAVYPISEGEWLDMGQMDELERMRKKLYDS